MQQDFFDLIVAGRNTAFAPITQDVARQAAALHAEYNLTLLDALQVAAALTAGCDVLLTNDATLRRVTHLRVLTLDELEP